MIVTLNSGRQVFVRQIAPEKFWISDDKRRDDFERLCADPPVIAGSYVPERLDWFTIQNIVERIYLARYIQDIKLEDGETIDFELPYEKDVVY